MSIRGSTPGPFPDTSRPMDVPKTLHQKEHMDRLASMGVRLLTPEEVRDVSINYAKELQIGIESNSQSPDGLPMYRSKLAPRSSDTRLPQNTYAAVVEIGGTHPYAAIVESDGNGNTQIAKDLQGEDLFIKSSFRSKNEEGKIAFRDSDDFFGEVADKIGPLLARSPKISSLGFIFSFWGEPHAISPQHIDIQSTPKLSKDFVIPGISEKSDGSPRYIGESLVEVLRTKYPQLFVEGDIPIAGGNDTVAVGLSHAGSRVGGVIGTGQNWAVAAHVDGIFQYLNTESGASTSVPETEIFKALGWSNTNRTINPAERQISGAGIGDILDYSAEYLTEQNLLPAFRENERSHKREKLVPETITELLEDNIAEVSRKFVRPLTEDEFLMLRDVASTLAKRSAQIAGTMLGTLVATFPDSFTEQDLFVPIEGSIFWKVPGYQTLFTKSARDIVPDKTFHYGDSEPQQAGVRGIGATALSMVA